MTSVKTTKLTGYTAKDVGDVVEAARDLILQHERRNPTSKGATLGELDALFNLRQVLIRTAG